LSSFLNLYNFVALFIYESKLFLCFLQILEFFSSQFISGYIPRQVAVHCISLNGIVSFELCWSLLHICSSLRHMLYWYCLILRIYCDELRLPNFYFTRLAFPMQGHLYIWLQNWWGNSRITTQQIYGPLVSSCMYIFAFLSRPGYLCNLLILVHSRCYCITFLLCSCNLNILLAFGTWFNLVPSTLLCVW